MDQSGSSELATGGTAGDPGADVSGASDGGPSSSPDGLSSDLTASQAGSEAPSVDAGPSQADGQMAPQGSTEVAAHEPVSDAAPQPANEVASQLDADSQPGSAITAQPATDAQQSGGLAAAAAEELAASDGTTTELGAPPFDPPVASDHTPEGSEKFAAQGELDHQPEVLKGLVEWSAAETATESDVTGPAEVGAAPAAAPSQESARPGGANRSVASRHAVALDQELATALHEPSDGSEPQSGEPTSGLVAPTSQPAAAASESQGPGREQAAKELTTTGPSNIEPQMSAPSDGAEPPSDTPETTVAAGSETPPVPRASTVRSQPESNPADPTTSAQQQQAAELAADGDEPSPAGPAPAASSRPAGVISPCEEEEEKKSGRSGNADSPASERPWRAVEACQQSRSHSGQQQQGSRQGSRDSEERQERTQREETSKLERAAKATAAEPKESIVKVDLKPKVDQVRPTQPRSQAPARKSASGKSTTGSKAPEKSRPNPQPQSAAEQTSEKQGERPKGAELRRLALGGRDRNWTGIQRSSGFDRAQARYEQFMNERSNVQALNGGSGKAELGKDAEGTRKPHWMCIRCSTQVEGECCPQCKSTQESGAVLLDRM